MDPTNVPNSGVSMNFDAQALHDAEEAEIQREEDERQNELKNLLTCAFDCDLSDEESIDEDTSHNFSQHQPQHDSISAETNENAQWPQQQTQPRINGGEMPRPQHALGGRALHQQFLMSQHASTPIIGQAPPPLMASPANQTQYSPYNQAQYQDHAAHRYQENAQYHTDQPTHGQFHQEAERDYNEANIQQFEGHNLLNLDQLRGTTAAKGAGENGVTSQTPFALQQGHEESPEEEDEEDNDDAIPYSAPTPTRPHHSHHSTYPSSFAPVTSGSANTHAQNYHYMHQHHHPHQHHYGPDGTTEDRVPGDNRGGGDEGDDIYGASMPDNVNIRDADHSAGISNNNQEGYKVQYLQHAVAQKPLVDTSGVSTVSQESEDGFTSEAGSTMPRPNTPPMEDTPRRLQKEFLSPEGTPRGGQFTQLEILYRARGNKIEELITELKQVKDDSDREIRILKHKLTLVEGERDGLKGSLDESQQLVADTKQREQQLQHKVHDFESQLQALVAQKTELLGKLEDSESHIEALSAQLADLGTSEALTRTREQHESVVHGLKHKHETEALSLRQELDSTKRTVEEKDEELAALKKEAFSLRKELETSKVERADSVNQLTRSPGETQRQNRELLESGVSQEASRLKIQLQDVIAGKSIAEDMNSALQEEMKELKEQLTMYESASQYLPNLTSGATAAESHAVMDDSYAQLGIKTSENSAAPPDSARSEETTMTAMNAETVHGLKRELERCLVMYKGKRQQLTEVTAQLKDARNNLEDLKVKHEKTEKELKETKLKLNLQEMSRSGASSLKEVRLQKEMDKIITEKENFRIEFEEELEKYSAAASSGASSLKEAQLQKQCEQLFNEKQILEHNLEGIRSRFEEVVNSEVKLTDLNTELRTQMSSMVRDYDEDKRMAVEKCQEACLQHHDTAKANLREELEAESQQKLQALSEEYDTKLETLREEVKAAQNEVDEVKESYLKVCEEKGHIEEDKGQIEIKVNGEWEQRLNVELHQLRLELQAERDSALEEQRENISTEHEVALANAKDIWRKEHEEETKQALKDEIEQAHNEWQATHDEEKQSDVQSAVDAAVKETEERLEQQILDSCQEQMQHQLQETKLKWQTDKRVSFERELQERLQAAKDTWTSTELPAAIEEEKQAWQKDMLGDFPTIDEKINKAITNAKKEWKTKEKKHRDQSENKVRELSKLVVEVETKVEKENWDLKQEVNKVRLEKSSLETEFNTAKDKWAKEKETLITEKDAEKESALSEVRAQAERDCEACMEEHQDTLNNALKAAREGQQKEREEMEKRHEDELQTLRTKLEKEIENLKRLGEEKEVGERTWQMKLDSLTAAHREEKEQLTAVQREQQHKALEEARTRWQADMEALTNEKQALAAREEELETENTKYRSELQRLEALLQSADAHMEAEISKLHGELEHAHNKQMSETVQSQVSKVESELSRKVDTVLGEKSALNGKLEETRSLLKELESKYKKDTSNLAEKARSYKHDLSAARKELEEKWRTQEGMDSQRNRVRELEKQLDKLERQRREAAETYRKSEGEYTHVVEGYKQRQNELSNQIQKLEQKLSATENEAKRQYAQLHESFEREQTSTVEQLKREVAEQRTKHKRAMDKLKAEFNRERNKYKAEIDAFKKQQKTLIASATQTDTSSSSFLDETTLHELRARYTRAVSKMKLDVIRHVTKSNELAAETVKIEVLKERHKTAARLRKYYMKCLAHLLDDDRSRDEKLKMMEAALDNLPSAATSAATSRANTPSGGAGDITTPTPSDFMEHALSSTLRSHGGGGGGTENTGAHRHGSSAHKHGSSAHQHGSNAHAQQAITSPHVNDERRQRRAGKLDVNQSQQHHSRSSRTNSTERSVASRSRSRGEKGSSGIVLQPYYGHSEGETMTPVARTPAETPIEELLRQEQILKEKLARQSQKSSSHRHRSSGDHGDFMDSQSTSKYSSGRDSDPFKSRSASTFDAGDSRLSNNSSKRTSFGAVTEYPRNSDKNPSEPSLSSYHQDAYISGLRSKSFASTNNSKDANVSGLYSKCFVSHNHSINQNETGGFNSTHSVQSAPASPPKLSSTASNSTKAPQPQYRYTSLRNNLNPSTFSPLSKAASASNLSESRPTKPFYKFPESAFGVVSKDSKRFHSQPEVDSESGTATPTGYISSERKLSSGSDVLSQKERSRYHRQKQVLSSSSGSSINKPMARRSSSESRLPRPVISALQNTNNNNCDVMQSVGSSFEKFEKFSPGDSGIGTRQPSLGTAQGTSHGYQYPEVSQVHESSTVDDRKADSTHVTELRLSWESNPPKSFNIHTRYAKP